MNLTYVISDIHGEYQLFIELLKKIQFDKTDKMIINGDIFDKGKESVKLLKFIKEQPNIYLIFGNHEYNFLCYYNSIMRNLEDDFIQTEVLQQINEYFNFQNEKLTWEDIEWLEQCPNFYENKDFICVHAGVELDENNQVKNLNETNVNFLINDRKFKEPNIVVKNSKCILFGHTPTRYINNEDRIIKYKRENVVNPISINDFYKIHLDCGTCYSHTLGCLCIDNLNEYYVTK